MQHLESSGLRRSTDRAMFGALASLLVTTVHHLRVVFICRTPEKRQYAMRRLREAGILSGIATTAIVGSREVLRRDTSDVAGKLALAVFTSVALAVPVAAIGALEGAYNHGLKNALYFFAGPSAMRRLFPPPNPGYRRWRRARRH